MQRIVALLGGQAVGLDHRLHIGGLDRDGDLVVVILFNQRDVVQRAVHHRLRGGVAVLCQDVLFQAAGVDPHADGDIVLLAALHHLAHPVLVADVAGVDAHLVHPGRHRFQRQPVVEVDIRHNRHTYRLLEVLDQRHRLQIGDGRADDLAARRLQTLCLLDACRKVLGRRVEHRLDGDRRAAAHLHLADQNLSGFLSLSHRFSFLLSC